MKLSPYTSIDWERALELIKSPNIRFNTALGKITPPNDNVFPPNGLIQLDDAVPKDLCNQVINDYERFEKFRLDQKCLVMNDHGRNYRLVNFHLESEALLKIGLLDKFHKPVSDFFGMQSSVYTSLTFKHGSQQDPHIDTPYFWTRPFNLFAGVWVALEDISEKAGPLFYYPGSHKYFDSEEELIKLHGECGGNPDLMFRKILEKVSSDGIEKQALIIKKGDAVIWHPGILHGGNKAINQALTRYSSVFHFAPVGVNVRMNDAFPKNFINYPKYGIKKKYGNYFCRGSLPTIMV